MVQDEIANPADQADDPSLPEPTRDKSSFAGQLTAVIVLCLLCLALFRLGAVPVVATAIFVFLDAWSAGIRKRRESKSFFNISPAAWAAAIVLMLVVAYPLYAIKRNSLKQSDGVVAFWVLANIAGAITLCLVALGILGLLAGVSK